MLHVTGYLCTDLLYMGYLPVLLEHNVAPSLPYSRTSQFPFEIEKQNSVAVITTVVVDMPIEKVYRELCGGPATNLHIIEHGY
jgi:hypothetical protein